jgi:hypothetical protein
MLKHATEAVRGVHDHQGDNDPGGDREDTALAAHVDE